MPGDMARDDACSLWPEGYKIKIQERPEIKQALNLLKE